MKKAPKRQKRVVATPKKCAYCEAKVEPTFKDTKMLEKFVTERGKIMGRLRTGLCAKHQRRVTLEVKHARLLALMPFMARV